MIQFYSPVCSKLLCMHAHTFPICVSLGKVLRVHQIMVLCTWTYIVHVSLGNLPCIYMHHDGICAPATALHTWLGSVFRIKGVTQLHSCMHSAKRWRKQAPFGWWLDCQVLTKCLPVLLPINYNRDLIIYCCSCSMRIPEFSRIPHYTLGNLDCCNFESSNHITDCLGVCFLQRPIYLEI